LAAALAATTLVTIAPSYASERPANPAPPCLDVFRPAAKAPTRPGDRAKTTVAGDFDEDGRLDLAVLRLGWGGGSPAGAVSILLGAGDGTFRPGPPVTAPLGGATRLVAGDFTGDAHLDLIAAPRTRPALVVLAGDGTGRFHAREVPAALGDLARAQLATDLDRNGRLDVVVTDGVGPAGGWESRVHLLLGDGAGGFSEPASSPLSFAEPVWQVVSDDFDGDGAPDLAVGFNWGAEVLRIFLGDGQGGLRAVPAAVGWGGGAWAGLRSVWLLDVADFDGDGQPDLAAALQSSDRLHVLLGDGSGRFREPDARPSVDDRPASLAIGNFDADRLPDVALGLSARHPAVAGSVRVLLSTGGGTLREAPGSPEPVPGPLAAIDEDDLHRIMAADFNSDGYDDLAVTDVELSGAGTLLALMNSAGRPRRTDRVPIRNDARQPRYRTRFGGVRFGARVRLSASIVCEPGALAGRRTQLVRRLASHAGRPGRWRPIATEVTDARGAVTATDRPAANADYRWRPADRRRPALQASAKVSVPVRQAVAVRVRRDTVRGRVRPPHPGRGIELQRSNGEVGDQLVWSTVATTRLTPRSRFALTVPRRRGVYRVCRAADPAHLAGTSRDVRRLPSGRLIVMRAGMTSSAQAACRSPDDG
jgi:hypothetical protein